MPTRRYAGLLAASLACLMLLVVLLSWVWVRQPQTGDLARIGGYVEASYESRADDPRMAFARPLFSSLQDPDRGPFDVLVLGDSFSYTGGRYNWVSQFVAQSGLRVRVGSIHRWRESLDGLEKSGNLPPLVILQSVERDMVDHLADINHSLRRIGDKRPKGLAAVPEPLVEPGPLQGLSRSPLPPKSFSGFDERVSVTIDVLWKSFRRRIGLPRDEVVVFRRDAGRPPIFSALEQEIFVTIPADLGSQAGSTRRWRQAIEGIGRLRSHLEGNAGSRMVLLVIPNRTSVYGPQLTELPARARSPLADRLARETGAFNAVHTLRASVESGIRDVYWAMDTHLSAVGAGLAARGFLLWLRQEGYLLRDSMIKSPLTEFPTGQ